VLRCRWHGRAAPLAVGRFRNDRRATRPDRRSGRTAAAGRAPAHYRQRYDRIDTKGRITVRCAGRIHHLGVGAAHARKRVLALADDHQVTVADLDTGELLSTHHIQPDKNYWRNQNRQPGRWPNTPT
jgi:hypothetical protein